MSSDYLDFDIAIGKGPTGYLTRVLASPAGSAEAPFVLPFELTELAQFLVAVGPPRVASRRLAPVAARLPDVRDYGTRLGAALLSGPVGDTFRASLATRGADNLRVRLCLDEAPELRPVPWEYLYDAPLARFLTLSSETPTVRLIDSVERPPTVTVEAPLRILVMIASPSDLPPLAVDREEQLLRATTADLVGRHQLELTVLRGADASLSALQMALLEPYHVFHFIGHGGFDTETQHGVLALERPDGTAHRVDGGQLATLLHDAKLLQLAVLNACEGARSSGHDTFSGVAQALVRQGLPAVVAMQTEISDRAALVFTHELYAYLTRGLPIDAAICEVRKAMSISDEAAEWGTAVLLRSGVEQPFVFPSATTAPEAQPDPEERWTALYEGAQGAIAAQSPDAALPMLEQLAVERPDYADVTQLLERVRPQDPTGPTALPRPLPSPEPSGTQSTQPPSEPPTPPEAEVDLEQDTEVVHEPIIEVRHHSRRLPIILAGAGLLVAAVTGVFLLTRDSIPPQTIADRCGPAARIPAVAGALVTSCAPTAPVIDGSFADWDAVSSIDVDAVVFRAKGDTNPAPRATWKTTWDRDALYVQADVVDTTPRDVNEAQPAQFWRGDAISFEFGPDARHLGIDAGVRNGRDRHVMVGRSGNGALGSVNVARDDTFPAGGLAPGIVAEGRSTSDGYAIEAKVPWKVLGLASAPARTWNLGVMISSNPERTVQRRPDTWQALVLADPS